MSTNGNGTYEDGTINLSGYTPHTPRFADMSSAQRSASMDATVQHLNDVTRQVNALTQAVNVLTKANIEARERLDALERAAAVAKVDYDGHIAWHSRSFMARLRARWGL